jgi:hypothetical protein
MSFSNVQGVPHINDVPATRCEKGPDCISRAQDGGPGWLCPECHNHLVWIDSVRVGSEHSDLYVCLSGCHLPVQLRPKPLFLFIDDGSEQ